MKKYTYLVLTLLLSTNLPTLAQPASQPYEPTTQQKNTTPWGPVLIGLVSGGLVGTGITYYIVHNNTTSSENTTRLNNEIKQLKARLQQQNQQQSNNQQLQNRINQLQNNLQEQKRINQTLQQTQQQNNLGLQGLSSQQSLIQPQDTTSQNSQNTSILSDNSNVQQNQQTNPLSTEPPLPQRPKNIQSLYSNRSKKREWPEEDNKMTLANTNQYQQGGLAACLHAASKLLKQHLQNPKQSLYNTTLLDQICREGANMLQGDQADEFNDIFGKYKNTYNFKLVSTGELNVIPMGEGNDIQQPNSLSYKNELEQEIGTGTALEYTTALVRNGPEAWALIVHQDKTISIFDSHGKENTKNYAYIKHFDNVNKLAQYIWENNALLNGNMNDLSEWQKLSYSLYIYWVDQG